MNKPKTNKKNHKEIKVSDLKPRKDPKGGSVRAGRSITIPPDPC